MKRRALRRTSAVLAALLLLPTLVSFAAGPVRYGTLPQVVDAPYIYDRPLPAADPVSLEWFGDAAFVGGGQTMALQSYQPLQPGLWLVGNDFDISSLTGRTFDVGGSQVLFAQALAESGCSKIYFMVGPGIVAPDDESFVRTYEEVIDVMRQALPQAQIYFQTFLPVTAQWAEETGNSNETYRHWNDLLRRIAREKQVYLVDVAAAFTTPSGAIPDRLSIDGLYLTTEGHYIWTQYLRSHTMGT